MNALSLAARYVSSRPLVNALTAVGVSLGVGLIVASLSLASAMRDGALRTAGDAQLLVAAKGSPFQAVLSTLFFAEPPVGNVPVALYREIEASKGITRVVPLNFGDNYRGRPIVGTTAAYLDMLEERIGRRPATTPPDSWADAPFEAVLGADAAARTGLTPGAAFVASHGFVELPDDLRENQDEQRYRVVSVLERTGSPADRAIFTALDTAWRQHHGAGAADQITALLVRGAGYGDVARLSAMLARRPDVQAIFPGRVVTRLMGYLDAGRRVVLAVSAVAGLAALIAVAITVVSAAADRKRQIATLRAIGASRLIIAKILLAEAAIIAGGGAALGLALGKAASLLIAARIEQAGAPPLAASALTPADLAIAAGAVGLALAAGAIPAWLACREDVVRNLAAPS